jgi:hypothetical protein
VTVDDDDDEGCDDCVTIILDMTAGFSNVVVGVGVLDVIIVATPETSDAVAPAGVGDLERQFFNHNSGVIKFSTMIN